MKSQLNVPIKIDDKTIGSMQIDEKLFRDICGDECMNVLKTAGDLLAIALKNAHLENEIRILDGVKADFISSFPHELRTPITVIRDSLSMLKEDMLSGQLSDKHKRILELTENNLERLWRLSEELQELSVIALAKTPGKRTLLDIAALMSKIVSKYIPIAREKGVTLSARIPDEKIEIWISEAKFSQMMGCLIDNAIKYNRPGGNAEVRMEKSDKSVTVTVSDTGSGIEKEDLGKVFDKFYRVTIRAKNLDKQWGTGLPIVKEIVEMHRGSISMESEPGKGTSVVITLPKSLRD